VASPVDADRIGTNITTTSDPWTVNLPPSIAAGDLLLLFIREATNVSYFGPPGFTAIVDDLSDASDDRTVVFWKKADGTEGATMTLDFTATVKGAAIVYRITGAADPTTEPPQGDIAIGTGANADPPNLAPPDGSKDYLWIIFGGMDGETQSFALPANYGNLIQANSGTGGAATSNVRIAGGSRQFTAASDNPAAFTVGAPSTGWSALTFAVHPAVPVVVRKRRIIVQNREALNRSHRW
jgi:hypothetical protein